MNIQKHITNTKKEIEGDHKEWTDDLLLRLSRGGVIFEIGSATSRDANYMEAMNPVVKVIRPSVVFDILKDEFDSENSYNAFYAHMVINHFTLDEVASTLVKIKTATMKGGYISISFPLGDNETLVDWNNTAGNIFCRYHSIPEIITIASNLGLAFVYLKETQDAKMCYVTFQV